MANEQSTWSPRERAPLSIDKGTAELAEIVVFIDGRTETSGILEFAGILAQEHSARLISVFMQPEPTVTPAETFARGKGMQSMIEVHQAQLERIEADHRAQFEDVVRRHGIRPESEWRSLPYLSSEVGVHAYYADMVVIARPESASQTAGPPGLAESLVLSSGRPIIVFPPRASLSAPWRTPCQCLSGPRRSRSWSSTMSATGRVTARSQGPTSRATWRVTARTWRYDDSRPAERTSGTCCCRKLLLSVPIFWSWAPMATLT